MFTERPLRRSLMSFALRRMQRPGVVPEKITRSTLPTFWSDERLPTLQAQVDNFVLWIGDNQRNSFDYAAGTPAAIAAHVGIPISPEGDIAALDWLRGQIDFNNWYEQGGDRRGERTFRLTLFGSQRYEQLKKVSRASLLPLQQRHAGWPHQQKRLPEEAI
jgi:hypothetical protein